MPLVKIELSVNGSDLPSDVRVFLRESNARVERYVTNNSIGVSGFGPSDFEIVYHALRAIVDQNTTPGNLFCEWGSGFGVVASLAAMLGFDAYGIEIDKHLYDASRSLASEFELPVTFIHGNFIPHGDFKPVNEIATESASAYQKLGLDVYDFDVVFAYPWPSEERVIEELFERRAHEGALLMTFKRNGFVFVRLHRKVGVKSIWSLLRSSSLQLKHMCSGADVPLG